MEKGGARPEGRKEKISGLWTLFEGLLMLANAVAILNEECFLAPRGWSFKELGILGLIHAVQYLYLPLIALNIIVTFLMLISG
ncbi:hypothetical protein KP509_07G001900 [Ceratopteris richardii]|uniref:Immediate early response 3-interacting protein 1 n=1 Tax=Ceratopteris richardii TaxID=49495 RepID=A0A8T2U9C6_CERRI|nr:hypothetical protein KP509_07G001900 [Ceratopteris richardii]